MRERSGDDLLTTGQAAAILGTTARHVVNLCLRGELSYTLAGTHRRLRRADAEALAERAAANRGGPLTDDQLRSLWLHRAAAARVVFQAPGSEEGRGLCLEPHDLAASKFAAGREKDLEFVGALLDAGLIRLEVLAERVAGLPRDRVLPGFLRRAERFVTECSRGR